MREAPLVDGHNDLLWEMREAREKSGERSGNIGQILTVSSVSLAKSSSSASGLAAIPCATA